MLASYCAAKGSVLALTRQLALDYGPDKIHVNALCPGFLKTIMTQNLQSDPGAFERINAAHPLRGMGNVDDVARMAVVLASDDVRWVTGVGLPVDGGFLCQ
jgi:NAD(P)-dependent dehydrogenase (short-subunit alcohol dehydrogenase family)